MSELGQLSLFAELGADLDESLAATNAQLVFDFAMRSVDGVLGAHPWLVRARTIAEREGCDRSIAAGQAWWACGHNEIPVRGKTNAEGRGGQVTSTTPPTSSRYGESA